jgi:hypothetical protein
VYGACHQCALAQRVLAHAHVTPWLFELRELVLRRALARLEPTEAAAAAEEVHWLTPPPSPSSPLHAVEPSVCEVELP